MNLLDTEKELFALYHKFPRERISFGLGTKKNMSICFAADKRPTGMGHTTCVFSVSLLFVLPVSRARMN